MIFYVLFAIWTGRGRFDDAHSQGNAVNQYIEEATPCEAEEYDKDYLFQWIVGAFTSPVWES